MKKIISMLLTVTMLWGICIPMVSYSAQSVVTEVVKEFDFTGFNEGTTGDFISPSLGDGVIIRSYDTDADKVCITTDPDQGKVMKLGPAKTSYDSGICIKRAPVVDNYPVLGIKIKPQAANATTWVNPACIDVYSSTSRICRLWLRWGSNGGTEYPRNLYLRNNTGSAWGSEHLIASDFDDGTPGWLDIKLVFNHAAQTYDIYVGDNRVATGESYFDTTADTDISGIYFYCSGDNGSIMVDDIKIYKSMPTTLKLTSPVDGATNADLTTKLIFTSNKENLVVDDAVLTITPEGESAVTLSGAASVDPQDSKKINFDISTSQLEMEYKTTYTGVVSGVKDTDGNDVAEASFEFTTREPRLIVGDPEFSNGVGRVVIKNERPEDPLAAAVFFVAFKGNELKDIAIDAATVNGGEDKPFTKELVYSADYSYKAFIWDGLTTMQPIGSFENASSIATSAQFDYFTGEGEISGTLNKGSHATTIILYPGKTLSDVTPDGGNIKDIVAFIGETDCGDDGDFAISFALNLPNDENGREITVLSGGNGIETPVANNFIYYNKETVKDIFDAIKNAASGEEIYELIAGEQLVNGVEINSILKLETEDFNKLTDKAAACENLRGMTFTDIESVHAAFKAAVERQLELEKESSGFTPVYFDFEPVDGSVFPTWSQGEKGSYTNAKVEPVTEALGEGKENSFHHFTFGKTSSSPGSVSYTEREWRAYIALEDVFYYNDTPKVISFKVRQGANALSGEMEMIGATLGDRSNKENIFTTGGSSICGTTVSEDEWHTVEIILDGTGVLDKTSHSKNMYTLLDGALVKTAVLTKNDGSIAVKHLQMHMSFPQEGNITETYLDFDDLSITEYNAPEITDSIPANGEKNVDISNKIKVVFDKAISGVTADNFKLYGGESVEVTSVAQSLDNKTVTFILNKNLDFATSYKVMISGIKDMFGEAVTAYIFEFSTRKKAVIAGLPSYFTADDATTDCSVTVKNEDDNPKAATVIFASFEGDKMIQAKMETNASFTGDWTPVINIDENDERKIKMFAWNSLSGMQPLSLASNMNSAKADVQIDYKTEKGKVKGTLSPKTSGAVATVLVLKPGMVPTDADSIAYIGEVICDENGYFSTDFEIEIPQADVDAKKEVSVYVGAKGIEVPQKTSFICYGENEADAVLTAIKNAADGKTIEEMLAGTVLVNDITVNEVLHLDIKPESDYANLRDKTAVCGDIAGNNFTNIEEVWNAFDEAVRKQKAYEAQMEDALIVLNSVLWDGMEDKLELYKNLFIPNLKLSAGTNYSKLNKNQKVTLYKQLANAYTFVFGADVDNDIETFAQKILSESKPSSGGGGGGGGGSSSSSKDETTSPGVGGFRGENDTEMSLSGIPITPQIPTVSFIDTENVSWAQESIGYLAQHNIINGVGNNKFAPNDAVTREQIVKIMVLAGQIDVSEENTVAFSDVRKDAWFSPYVSAGVKSGLVTGFGDGTFGSGKNVTRQDLAVFIVRLAKIMKKELPVGNKAGFYSDNGEISEYARSAVYILRDAGIMNGVGNDNFAPNSSVTRAMAAKAVYELLQYGE